MEGWRGDKQDYYRSWRLSYALVDPLREPRLALMKEGEAAMANTLIFSTFQTYCRCHSDSELREIPHQNRMQRCHKEVRVCVCNLKNIFR